MRKKIEIPDAVQVYKVYIERSEAAARKGIWLLKLLKAGGAAEDHAVQGWSRSCSRGLDVRPLFRHLHPSEGIAEFLF